MTQKRVVILDGSFSIFGVTPRGLDQDVKATTLDGDQNGAVGVLQPIAEFRQLLFDVVRDMRLEDSQLPESDSIALIEVGLVCHVSIAGKMGLAVFRKIVEKLGLRRCR